MGGENINKIDEEQKARLFIKLLRDYGSSIHIELMNAFCPVFMSNYNLAIATIEDDFNNFSANVIFPKSNPYKYNFDYPYDNKRPAKVKIDDIKRFRKAIEEFKKRNDGALEKYLEDIIRATDFSGFLRFFRNLSKDNSKNQKLADYCKKTYNCELREKKYNKVFQNSINLRNDYSHENMSSVDKFLPNENKKRALDVFKNVTNIFFKENNDLKKYYNEGEIIIASTPITFDFIFQKYKDYLLDENTLSDEFEKNCNLGAKKIYGLTIEKLNQKIARLAIPSQIQSEVAYENNKSVANNVATEVKDYNSNVLHYLLRYKDAIDKNQIIELANNIPIFIDGKVFQGNGFADDNEYNQRLLNNEILRPLEEIKKYAIVNFSSRVELNVETNKSDSNDIKLLSKNARDVISYFVTRGSIKYGQKLGRVYSKGIYETLKFVQQNNKNRFFIIVNSLEDANLIDDETSNCLVARIIGFADKKKLIFTKKTVAKLNNIANYIGFNNEECIAKENDAENVLELNENKNIESKGKMLKEVHLVSEETPHIKKYIEKKNETKIPVLGTVKCKPENGAPLPLTVKISKGTKLFDQNNNEIILGEFIGEGGEGTVYSVDENTVAKVYNNKHLTQNRKEKLELLTSSSLKINKVCLPSALLFDERKEFVGYTMPKAPSKYQTFGESILQLGSTYSRNNNKDLNTWNRESLARLCSKLAKTFQKIHDENILIGDINANNILINLKDNQGGDFLIVDTDSFQIGPYPSPVGTPVFTSPEIYKRENTENPRYGDFLRTLNDEEYAIASLLFQIIMLGQTPFAGKGVEGEGIEALKNYNFDFRGSTSTGADTPDGPYRMIWTNTPKYIKDAFEKVFTGRGIVRCDEWSTLFFKYADSIKNNKSTNELMPYRYPKSDIMVEFKCEICKRDVNLPKSRYDRLVNYKDILCCAECNWKKIPSMKRETRVATCEECGANFKESKYKLLLHIKDPQRIRIICQNCDKLVENKCSRCGKTYMEKRYRINKYGSRAMCKECNDFFRSRKGV